MNAARQSLGFEIKEVSDFSGVSIAQLRRWHRSGLLPASLRCGRRLRYALSDILAARAAHALLGAGAPMRQLTRTLRVIRQRRPSSVHPLAQQRFSAHRGQIVQRIGVLGIEPPSAPLCFWIEADTGQLSFTFDALPPPHSQPSGEGEVLRLPVQESAVERWLSWAQQAERAQALAEAHSFYREALRCQPDHPAALIGLGNLACLQSRYAEARDYYQRCAEVAPSLPEPWFNLGNTLEALDATDAAVRAYERALSVAQNYESAHFNLALLWEKLGQRQRALGHWRRCLALSHDPQTRACAQYFIEDTSQRP